MSPTVKLPPGTPFASVGRRHKKKTEEEEPIGKWAVVAGDVAANLSEPSERECLPEKRENVVCISAGCLMLACALDRLDGKVIASE